MRTLWSPPALLTAAVSSGVEGPPATGASTIGTANRSRTRPCRNDTTTAHRSSGPVPAQPSLGAAVDGGSPEAEALAVCGDAKLGAGKWGPHGMYCRWGAPLLAAGVLGCPPQYPCSA